MPQVCKVCTHEKRFEIDRAIARGGNRLAIARKFDLPKDSVYRHGEDHLAPGIVEEAERERLAENGTCQSITRRIVKKALEGVEAARDTESVAKTVNAATNAARLLGQTTGEVQNERMILLFQSVGIKDEDELRDLVKLKRAGEALTVEQAEEDGLELLRWVIAEKPERAEEILRQLVPRALEAKEA